MHKMYLDTTMSKHIGLKPDIVSLSSQRVSSINISVLEYVAYAAITESFAILELQLLCSKDSSYISRYVFMKL